MEGTWEHERFWNGNTGKKGTRELGKIRNGATGKWKTGEHGQKGNTENTDIRENGNKLNGNKGIGEQK